MEKWEKALYKFLEKYVHQDWFEGALLCGSYAAGNQNEFSDIDVTIIASNSLGWQEKSNCYVDGFLMEYTINPISRFEQYMEESLKEHNYTNQYLLLYGKVLYDVHGEIQKLRDKAALQVKQPFEPLSDYDKKFIKYYLWDRYDELLSLSKKNLHTDLQYWCLVDALITAYYNFHNLAHVPHSKIEQILTDSAFAKRYHIKDMPQPDFVQKLLDCFRASDKEQKLAKVKELYDLVMDSDGGFDIGQFVGKRELVK